MTTTITSSCACKAFTYTFELDNTSPPTRAFCLCNTCRLTTGSSFGSTYIWIPYTIDPSKYSVTNYKTSGCNRYFCSTCGAHAFVTIDREEGPPITFVTSGLWDKTEGIIEWKGCKYVEDSLDGGCSVWFNSITSRNGTTRPLKRWLQQDRGSNTQIVSSNELRVLEKRPSSEKLEAQCQCGGVKFYITRPNEASKKVTSPFPDLMIPYHQASNENPNNEPWCLRANNTKYMAGTCTCPSCRLSMGMEVQTWAFIPKCNIFKSDGTPLTSFDFGTTKSYASSEGVTREFCGKCGATVFWHCDWRPELIDVSTGLFDPREGARVEGWLEWWTERVSFREMAVSKSLVESLEEGLKGMGKNKGTGKCLVK